MTESGTPEPAPRGEAFVTTRWTRVLEARGDTPKAKMALSELCEAYYAPVFAFIRREAPNEDTARDLTQEFFSQFLARGGIDAVDPARGKFRSYLLGAVKHFLSDAHSAAVRLKRGGGQSLESLDASNNESPGPSNTDPNVPAPDKEFDRHWALAVLQRAVDILAAEHRAAGKEAQFDALKPWLTGETEAVSQAEAAAKLGWTENAFKVAVHRLRRRFRAAIKSEIQQTLGAGCTVEEEMRYLLEALI